ncbi:MAG TPA: S8 family peptidase [Methyloceanibacter sp.]|nr:S8 family peptidase [Methyloceanibacter sp.]
MRLIVFLIGLVAMASVGAAQSLPYGSSRVPFGSNKPSGPSIKPTGPSIKPGGPGLNLPGPSLIPPVTGRKCPRGTEGKWPDCKTVGEKKCPDNTTGKWPKCKPNSTASCAQKGLIGKWPNCRKPDIKRCPKGTEGIWPACVDIAKPGGKECPEGQVRKGKKCVQVTDTAPVKKKAPKGPPKEPPKATAKKQPAPIPPAIAALVTGRPHQPREILVLVNAARADEITARLAREHNVTAEPRVPLALLDGVIVRLRLRQGQSLEALLAAIDADPDVDLTQPNYDYTVSKNAALPKGAPQYAGETIRLEEAHRLARGQGVMIAVIDTAIDEAHPELAGVIAGKFDAVGSGPARPEPHGTEIAGILAARAELTGVAPEAKLLSVRAFSGGKTKSAQSTSLQLLKGIDWAYDAGAKIMNMSFTGPMDPLLERAIEALAAKGVIVVAAAGNEGPKAPPVYPAAYPEVIAVTATDEKDKLYGKANRGEYVFIAAPGVDIVAPGLKGSYGISSGTSMAAAHVSGVVALLMERNAKLSASDVRQILSSSARKPGEPLGKEAVGAGILDAAGALGERADGGAQAQPAAATAVSEGR